MSTWSRFRAGCYSAGAAVVIVALFGSGCSGSSDGEQSSSEDQYLRSLLGEATPRQSEEIMRLVLQEQQTVIASCMRGEGFEYEPAPADALYVAGTGFDLDDEDDVDQYGFGISTIQFDQRASTDNPNDAIYSRLDSATRSRWSEQLATCTSAAENEVDDELGLEAAAATASRVYASVENDPDVVAATTTWASCMRSEGYTASDPDQLVAALSEEWQQTDTAEAEAFRARELEAARISFECGHELREARQLASEEALRGLDEDAYERIYGS